jgi:hypothetical protein
MKVDPSRLIVNYMGIYSLFIVAPEVYLWINHTLSQLQPFFRSFKRPNIYALSPLSHMGQWVSVLKLNLS